MSSSKWKPYPNYTESNFEFIPKYPSHWELKRMQWIGKFSASGIDKKSVETESDCLMVNYTDVYGNETAEIHSNQDFMKTTATSQKIVEHYLEKGDILFTPSSETADDIGVSAVAIEDMPGIVYSYHLTRFRPSIPLGVDFSRFFCNSVPVLSQLSAVTRGTTRKILSREDFNTLNILVPPDEERRKIGHFLSEKNKQITASIKLLESKLALLEEKRSVLITQAITQGFNPNMDMKNSGISWLGDIPSHWSLSKVGYLSKIISKGTTPSTLNREFVPQGIKFLKAENIHYDGSVSALPNFYIDEETDKLLKRSRLKSNDILMVIAGATTGKCAILNSDFIPANTNQAVCFIRLNDTRISKFIQSWLSCELIQEQIKQDSVQSAQPNLAMEEIRNFVCPLPPIDEIEHITNRIIEFTNIISNSKSILEKQINCLIEYRESLISAAVTGKIDVRSL
jgi:type I restriction enzyme, S subunit